MPWSILADDSVKLALVAAVVASLVLAPVARSLARRLGVLDNPDSARKHHRHPVPLWGGVAVYLALVVGLLVRASARQAIRPSINCRPP